MFRWLVLSLSLSAAIFGSAVLSAQPLPKRHTSRDWSQCERCRRAYDRALDHTLRRLEGKGEDQEGAGDSPEDPDANYDYFNAARFPATMTMGWLLLADGRYPKQLNKVVERAIAWNSEKEQGENKVHNHRWNWHPALAGMFLTEYAKYFPSRKTFDAIKGIVAHLVKYQEDTGGWFKSYHGSTRYPVKDLGMLDGLIYGFLRTAKAQGINLPPSMMVKAEKCLARITGGGGISYGTGQSGPDKTGGRGGLALRGLVYAGDKGHRIARTYSGLLPRRIPNMHLGHHVGGLHAWSVVIGCYTIGPSAFKKLTAHWLDTLINKQKKDGGVYVGDDEDAGGEEGLLGADDTSTAAFGLMVLLQDSSRLNPRRRPRINWVSLVIDPPTSKQLKPAARSAISGKLDKLLSLLARTKARKGAAYAAARTEAEAIEDRVTRFIAARVAEAEQCVQDKDVSRAIEILTPLSKVLKKYEQGKSAQSALDRIKKDPACTQELAAQKALAKAWKIVFARGMQKAKPAFEKLVKQFAGTAAARNAKEMLD